MKLLIIGEPSEWQQRMITAFLKAHPDAEVVREPGRNYQGKTPDVWLDEIGQYDKVIGGARAFRDIWMQQPIKRNPPHK